MKKSTTLILTALLAAASFGATTSTTLPTTTQASAAAPAPTTNPYLALRGMSADYIVLTNASIFKKGSQMTDPFAPATPPLPPPRPQPYPSLRALSNSMAMHADASWTTFSKILPTTMFSSKHEGDNIARGKITAITLDSIDYETNGRQNTIAAPAILSTDSESPGLSPRSVALFVFNPAFGQFQQPPMPTSSNACDKNA